MITYNDVQSFKEAIAALEPSNVNWERVCVIASGTKLDVLTVGSSCELLGELIMRGSVWMKFDTTGLMQVYVDVDSCFIDYKSDSESVDMWGVIELHHIQRHIPRWGPVIWASRQRNTPVLPHIAQMSEFQTEASEYDEILQNLHTELNSTSNSMCIYDIDDLQSCL